MKQMNTWNSLTDEERAEYVARIIDRFKEFAVDRATLGLDDASSDGHDFVLNAFISFVQIEDGLSHSKDEDTSPGLDVYMPPVSHPVFEGLSFADAQDRIRTSNYLVMCRPRMAGICLFEHGILLYRNSNNIGYAKNLLSDVDRQAVDWQIVVDLSHEAMTGEKS
jgi:hypothetical protein